MNYSNKDIAKQLKELAMYAQLDGVNRFKIRAYKEAANIIENYPTSLEKMVKNKQNLKQIPHIGKKIEKKIYQLINSGKISALERYRAKYPASLLELLAIPGIGAKKAMILYKKLNVNSLNSLQSALKSGELNNLKGFGKKLIKHIQEGLTMLKQEGKRFLYANAKPYANDIVEYMQKHPKVKKAIVAGSFRRKKESVGDLDLVVVCKKKDSSEVVEHFRKYNKLKDIITQGSNRATIVLENSLQIDLKVAQSSFYGATLSYFTGSKAHTLHIRKMAKEIGWKVSEYGIFKDETKLDKRSEKSFYKTLGLDFIEPELRELRGEFEAAKNHTLPKLLKQSDIKGDLHIHTNFSDGVESLENMVVAAYKKGYKYIAITDHSWHIPLLHGLDEDRLLKQIEIIDKLNQKYKNFKILKGIEVDILKDGSLALSDDLLEKLDIVVASIHDYFNLSKIKQTNRIIKAMQNPNVNIIGHISGRLIQQRAPYPLNYTKIFEVAKKESVAIEINSQPQRLDINDIYAKLAKEMGVKFAINSDAHHIKCLDYIEYGVNQARRGWLEKKDVINTWGLKKLKEFLDK